MCFKQGSIRGKKFSEKNVINEKDFLLEFTVNSILSIILRILRLHSSKKHY